jgi:tRNA nucleotidyltransferase (CCA-adding enzyme)
MPGPPRLKMTEGDAEELTQRLVEQIAAKIPQPVPVSDFMTTEVVAIGPEASLFEARAIMDRHGHSGLPVVDEDQRLMGMIEAHDITNAAAKSGEDVLRRPVSGYMHKKAFGVAPETPLYVAEQIITENSLGRLPVVGADDTLQGIVSRTDVLVQRRMWYPHVVTEGLAPSSGKVRASDNGPSLHGIGRAVGSDRNGTWD